MSPKALCIFNTRNVRIKSEKSNLHENTRLGDTWNQSVFYNDVFETIYKVEFTLSHKKGQASDQTEKKVGKLKPYNVGFAGQGSVCLRLAGSADILTLWSCQIRALTKKAGNS